MLKKALTFLGFFLAITLTVYCLNTYAKINTELATNTSVGYYKNTETAIATYPVGKNNKIIEVDAPEKVMAGSFTLTPVNSPVHTCNTIDAATFTISYATTVDYDETTTFSASSANPELAGAIYSFPSGDLTVGPVDFNMVTTNLTGIAPGTYTITVLGTGSGAATFSVDVTLTIDDFTVVVANTTAPVNGATGIAIVGHTFTWNAFSNATFYFLDIATDPGFTTIVKSKKVTTGTSWVNDFTLTQGTIYYWRVRGRNACVAAPGTISTTKNFQTLALDDTCGAPIDSGTINLGIPDAGSISNVLNVASSITISDVNVTLNITHDLISDLVVTLESPLGTTITLFDNQCGDQNLNATFDDSGSLISCTYPITGLITPVNALSSFNGEDTAGNWTLTLTDSFGGDVGTLVSWSLELCEAVAATVTDSVLFPHDDYNFLSSSVGSELVPLWLEATSAGSTALEQVFTITQLPTYTLFKNGVAFIAIGETFTQDDINNNLITYNNTAPGTEIDTFMVDITNATNGFLPNQIITINLDLDALLGVDDDFFIKTGISIFPTVSNGEFKISSSKYLGKAIIELYTYTGMRVFTDELNFNGNTLESVNVSNLAQGIYILKIISDTTVGSKKIIIR
ncbi:MAG: T9SS type A sorting domain-containing protein [Lutibacter sp.]|uniref:proprotein convertase P-domain-containing protein n=1 Tax=Lutibacter sp. TaxID=1925666 RepID=UPI0019FC626C|nr:proprotein convertase P-domain-containing protein [Lutibacter sp.]NOR28877.1 T9SS type A sorting domain-containing protein [Lutibacter sp.]